MGDVVNLRQAKKQAARKAASVTADANAARFGRNKAQRKLEEAASQKAARELEAHRREAD